MPFFVGALFGLVVGVGGSGLYWVDRWESEVARLCVAYTEVLDLPTAPGSDGLLIGGIWSDDPFFLACAELAREQRFRGVAQSTGAH